MLQVSSFSTQTFRQLSSTRIQFHCVPMTQLRKTRNSTQSKMSKGSKVTKSTRSAKSSTIKGSNTTQSSQTSITKNSAKQNPKQLKIKSLILKLKELRPKPRLILTFNNKGRDLLEGFLEEEGKAVLRAQGQNYLFSFESFPMRPYEYMEKCFTDITSSTLSSCTSIDHRYMDLPKMYDHQDMDIGLDGFPYGL